MKLEEIAAKWTQWLGLGYRDGETNAAILGALKELDAAHAAEIDEFSDYVAAAHDANNMCAAAQARLEEAEWLLDGDETVPGWRVRRRAFLAAPSEPARRFEQLVEAVGPLPTGQLAAPLVRDHGAEAVAELHGITTEDGAGCQACADGVDHASCEPYFEPAQPEPTRQAVHAFVPGPLIPAFCGYPWPTHIDGPLCGLLPDAPIHQLGDAIVPHPPWCGHELSEAMKIGGGRLKTPMGKRIGGVLRVWCSKGHRDETRAPDPAAPAASL